MRYIQKEKEIIEGCYFDGTMRSVEIIERIFPEIRRIYIGLSPISGISKVRYSTHNANLIVYPSEWIIKRKNQFTTMTNIEFSETYKRYE